MWSIIELIVEGIQPTLLKLSLPHFEDCFIKLPISLEITTSKGIGLCTYSFAYHFWFGTSLCLFLSLKSCTLQSFEYCPRCIQVQHTILERKSLCLTLSNWILLTNKSVYVIQFCTILLMAFIESSRF